VLPRKCFHVFERVVGIGDGVIAHDRNAADAVLAQLGHVANDLGDDRFHVWAVIADEHDHRAVGAAHRFVRVALAVGAEEIEGCGGPAGLAHGCGCAQDGGEGIGVGLRERTVPYAQENACSRAHA